MTIQTYWSKEARFSCASAGGLFPSLIDIIGCCCCISHAAVFGFPLSRQLGRVGIFGGSKDYTGAPFFASMSALRTGADLAYVLTAEEAAPALKAYSPELMVRSDFGTTKF